MKNSRKQLVVKLIFVRENVLKINLSYFLQDFPFGISQCLFFFVKCLFLYRDYIIHKYIKVIHVQC